MSQDKSEPIKSVEDIKVPDEFYKIINDFVIDILTTFPELKDLPVDQNEIQPNQSVISMNWDRK